VAPAVVRHFSAADHVRLNARRFRSVPVLLVLFGLRGGRRPTVSRRRPVPVRVPVRRVRRRVVVVVVVVVRGIAPRQSRRPPGGRPTVRRQSLDDGRRRETAADAREYETVIIISGGPVTEYNGSRQVFRTTANRIFRSRVTVSVIDRLIDPHRIRVGGALFDTFPRP